MAKSQKHSNREAKKPKQIKAVAAPVAGEGLLSRATNAPTKKKGA